MINKLLHAIPAAFLWTKALDRASHGEFEKALDCLSRIERFGIKYFEYDILGGVAANRTGRHELAIRLFNRAMASLQNDRLVAEPVRAYLICFILSCIQDTNKHFYNDSNKERDNPLKETEIDYLKVHLNQVPERVKRNFPLFNHPNWRKETERVAAALH
jgi:hypothetical protein